jgi:hypothetical protein
VLLPGTCPLAGGPFFVVISGKVAKNLVGIIILVTFAPGFGTTINKLIDI